MIDSVPADDPTLIEALTKYHRWKETNDTMISKLLKADHGIEMR